MFLDVTHNLNNNSYKHFSKSNAFPAYMDIYSIHPTHMVKQIPEAINIRISTLSSTKIYSIIITILTMKFYTKVV